MTPGFVIAVLGAVFVAPFVWAATVALARRAAIGWSAVEAPGDAHEKAVLALMLAPIALGAAFLLTPPEAVSVDVPPLLNFTEIAEGFGARTTVAPLENPFDWISFVGFSLLALYALGVVRYALPLVLAQLRLWQWAAKMTPHPKFLDVCISDLATTPLAVSNRRVLFPRLLIEVLSAEQTELVVVHERHHHARGDVAFYAVVAWIETLLWFNPFVRGQVRHCRLAAELDCDRAVTDAAPEMRRTYAQTLLVVLKHSAGNALQCAPAVFSHRAVGEHRMRILNIMKSDADTRKRTPWFAYVTALALVVPFGLAQLALAQSGIGASDHAPLQAPTPISTQDPNRSPFAFDRAAFSHRPLDGRITGSFGARPDAFTGEMSFHPGVDIAAAMGTPVVAPADGRVMRVTTNTDYGNMIEIDHGDGIVLRYAHLSAFDVRESETVRDGEIIGRVGNSGRSSATQLHVEVWRDNRAWDPRMVLDLPAE